MPWQDIGLSSKIFENVDESALNNQNAALENAYINDVGGISRFPRLKTYATLPFDKPVYLYPKEFRGDLHGVCSGHVFRITDGGAEDLTTVVVAGGNRPTFAETDRELVIAAGGEITSLRGERTEILSETAPQTTHVGYIDGYLTALEIGTGRFRHAPAGQPGGVWDPLDTFSAEGKPDDITALIVTEFNELMLAGIDSIEQFDSAPEGSSPFFRRWSFGPGIYAPYTFTFADGRLCGVNRDLEWVSFATQLGTVESEDIQQTLESVDNWDEAWAQDVSVKGQRFMIIQMPNATNRYGQKGLTLCQDIRKKRWTTLYGWDSALGIPTKWQGYSIAKIAGRTFVGGVGKIYEMSNASDGDVQRMLWRSGHISRLGQTPFSVEEVVLRVKRGVGTTTAPIIGLRVNKNNKGFGRLVKKSLGLPGQNEMTLRFPKVGKCESVQFELQITDSADVQIASMAMRTDEYSR